MLKAGRWCPAEGYFSTIPGAVDIECDVTGLFDENRYFDLQTIG